MTTQEPNYLYDLSNSHFEQTEILTLENKTLKGQFVQFKVGKGKFDNLYPAEKYCFLPQEHAQRFKKECIENNGEFPVFPDYVMQISMRHIKEIKIMPALVTGLL